MDLSCIILSGDLELYVLGMLPQDEAEKMEQLAAILPEVREEIDRISEALLGLAAQSSLAPSPAVKDKLMQQLQQLGKQEKTAAPVVAMPARDISPSPEQSSRETSPLPVTAMRKRNPWLSAASFIGFILALGGAIFFAFQNKQSKEEIVALQTRMRTLNRTVVEQQRENLAAGQMLQMLQSDAYKKIKLTAVPGKPEAVVQVFWNPQTSEVFINDISLPNTPAGRQYQLWAIVDGKPVDAGMLSNVKNRAQQMKRFERAEAFAITLEREGGSPTPTMEEMYVMGKT